MRKLNLVFNKRVIMVMALVTLILAICIPNAQALQNGVSIGLTTSQQNKIKNFASKLISGRKFDNMGKIDLTNLQYNRDADKRCIGLNYNYDNFTKNTKLYFDCSSFVSTVYNRALGKINYAWSTGTFKNAIVYADDLNNATKSQVSGKK